MTVEKFKEKEKLIKEILSSFDNMNEVKRATLEGIAIGMSISDELDLKNDKCA